MTAYASPADVQAPFDQVPKGRRLDRLEALLEEATDEIRAESGGRDYFRHPTAGSRTWLGDGDGLPVFHAHYGIAEALDLLEISLDGGFTFVTVAESNYQLLGADPNNQADPPEGEPWFHVRLLMTGAYWWFPRGVNTVRFTGASGWPTVPRRLVEGTVERARQLAFADPSYEGNVASDDAYGRPAVGNKLPDVVWRFLRDESRRFAACST